MRKRNQRVLTARLRGIVSEWFYLRPPASETRNQSGRLCFPCTMQGWINTGAHDRHLISHAKETSKLWQNLVRAMDEGFEPNAHRWNSPADAPALSMAFLLPVGLADIDMMGKRFLSTSSLPITLSDSFRQ